MNSIAVKAVLSVDIPLLRAKVFFSHHFTERVTYYEWKKETTGF